MHSSATVTIGTVRTLRNRDLISNQSRDTTTMRFYNALKEFETTVDSSIEDFEDLTLSDIEEDKVFSF
jgi:hypothetical protein